MDIDEDRTEELEKWTFAETITVQELIDAISKFPPKTKVCTTWESTIHTLLTENIYMSKWGVLFIDADDNFYKNEFRQEP